MVTNPLLLLRMAGSRRKGNTVLALRLSQGLSVGYELISTRAGASIASIGTWTLRLRDARSADSLSIGARSSTVVYLGPRSRASPVIKEGRRKFACRMSIYDRSGLSTSNA